MPDLVSEGNDSLSLSPASVHASSFSSLYPVLSGALHGVSLSSTQMTDKCTHRLALFTNTLLSFTHSFFYPSSSSSVMMQSSVLKRTALFGGIKQVTSWRTLVMTTAMLIPCQVSITDPLLHLIFSLEEEREGEEEKKAICISARRSEGTIESSIIVCMNHWHLFLFFSSPSSPCSGDVCIWRSGSERSWILRRTQWHVS